MLVEFRRARNEIVAIFPDLKTPSGDVKVFSSSKRDGFINVSAKTSLERASAYEAAGLLNEMISRGYDPREMQFEKYFENQINEGTKIYIDGGNLNNREQEILSGVIRGLCKFGVPYFRANAEKNEVSLFIPVRISISTHAKISSEIERILLARCSEEALNKVNIHIVG